MSSSDWKSHWSFSSVYKRLISSYCQEVELKVRDPLAQKHWPDNENNWRWPKPADPSDRHTIWERPAYHNLQPYQVSENVLCFLTHYKSGNPGTSSCFWAYMGRLPGVSSEESGEWVPRGCRDEPVAEALKNLALMDQLA